MVSIHTWFYFYRLVSKILEVNSKQERTRSLRATKNSLPLNSTRTWPRSNMRVPTDLAYKCSTLKEMPWTHKWTRRPSEIDFGSSITTDSDTVLPTLTGCIPFCRELSRTWTNTSSTISWRLFWPSMCTKDTRRIVTLTTWPSCPRTREACTQDQSLLVLPHWELFALWSENNCKINI